MVSLQPDDYVVSADTLARLGGGDPAKGRARLRLMLAETRDHPLTPVQKPDNVRFATVRDEPAILDLLLEDLEENATQIAPPSIKQIMTQIECGTRGRGGFTLVIDNETGPVGVAIVSPVQWWFSESWFLQEIVLYVSPQARNRNAGRDLLMAERWIAEQMSETVGHRVFLLAGVTATKRRSAKLRLYGQQMMPVGGFFLSPAVEGIE